MCIIITWVVVADLLVFVFINVFVVCLYAS